MTSAPGSISVVTRHAPNNLKRAALFAALFVCVGLGITLFLAATQWFSLWTPVYIMALASLPITFITTVISTSQEDETSIKRMIPSAIVALFVSMTLGIFGGFAWREASVRQWALESAATRGAYGILQQAIQSEDVESASVACGVMLGSKDPTARGKALDALEQNPKLAGACLAYEGLEEMQRETLADLLTDRWWTRMEASEGSQSCAWAEALGTTADVTTSGDVALLSCAMSAREGAMRDCCTQSLAARDIVGKRLAERANAFPYKTYEEAMADKLLASAFSSGSLKGQESARAKKLMLTSPQMRGYALERACEFMTLDDRSIPTAREFYGMTDALCGLRAPKLREDTAFWVGVCAKVEAEAAALEGATDNQKKLEETICAFTKHEMVNAATSLAQQIVHAATSTGDGNTFTNKEKLVSGINRAAGRAAATDNGKLFSVNQGQYEFKRNDTGYISESVQEAQLTRRRQEEYKKSRTYKEIGKASKENLRVDKETGKARRKNYAGPNSMSIQEVREMQERFEQR